MLWVKSIHVFFVVAWFAGLFYLPRLFVYHADIAADDNTGHERFCTMERRLYVMTTVGMVGTWIFGIWLLSYFPGYLQVGWLHAKLTLVVLLSGYHGWTKVTLRRFAARSNRHSAKFYRAMNEVPTLALLAVVILVIVKPF